MKRTSMGPEALWSIEFIDNDKHRGGGIAVLYRKRVLGGSNAFAYIGEYKLIDDDIHFNVRVRRFSDVAEGAYKDEYTLVAKGKYDDLKFVVTGSPEDNNDYIMAIQLTRQGEIP